MPLHNHLLLNGLIADPPGPEDEQNIKDWLEVLVREIDMKKVAGPISCYVKSEGNVGMTAGVLIETSHIAMHIWNEPNPARIQFDLYTCSTLPLQTVLRKLDHSFGLVNYEYQVIERGRGFRVVVSDSN